MARQKSLFCLGALLLSVVIVNLQRAEAQCGNFQEYCINFIITSSGEFSAGCANDTGLYHEFSINLDDFIGNDNGQLVDGNDFVASCKNLDVDYGLTPPKLGGDCKTKHGHYEHALYDLTYHLANDNGILSWHSC